MQIRALQSLLVAFTLHSRCFQIETGVHPFIRHLSVAEYTFELAVETDFTNHCIIKVEHLKCWS